MEITWELITFIIGIAISVSTIISKLFMRYLESMETAPGMQQAWSKLGIEREKALALAYPQDVTRILGKKEFKSWKESTDKKEVSVTNTNTTVINQYNERTSSTR